MTQVVLAQFRTHRAGVVVNVTSSVTLARMPMAGLIPEAYATFAEKVFSGFSNPSEIMVGSDMAETVAYVLAVEAKADEPYGGTVADVFVAALKRGVENLRSNGIARIQGLAGFIFRPRAGSPNVGGLCYQLLTACAGPFSLPGASGVELHVGKVKRNLRPGEA